MRPVIALLTDFGLDDIYAGVMKGVILNICPETQIIDITHAVDPQNIRQAAFALMNAYRYFPPATVFLVVVDPGVGTVRRPVAVTAGGYRFVAPDNGVLHYSLSRFQSIRVVELKSPAHRLVEVSSTFHGRDIFAPAAAHLAAGVPLEELGDPIEGLADLKMPELTAGGGHISGEVIHIDHFGNLVTSIGYLRWQTPEHLSLEPAFWPPANRVSIRVPARSSTVKSSRFTIKSIRATYGETTPGDLLALVGSSGFLEIGINQGSAVRRLNAAVGDWVEIEIGDAHAAVRD